MAEEDWGALPFEAIRRLGKKPTAIRLYPVLWHLAKRRGGTSSVQMLGEEIGSASRNIRRSLDAISESGLIDVDREYGRVRIVLRGNIGDFGKVPLDIAGDVRLSATDVAVYAYARWCSDDSGRPFRQSDCIRSIGFGRTAVLDSLSVLEDSGLVTFPHGRSVGVVNVLSAAEWLADEGVVEASIDESLAPTHQGSSKVESKEAERPDVELLCGTLHASLNSRSVSGKLKTANTRERRAARLLIDKSSLNFEQILSTLNWGINHDWWRGKIRSIEGFRRNFDTIYSQRVDEERNRHQSYRPVGMDPKSILAELSNQPQSRVIESEVVRGQNSIEA